MAGLLMGQAWIVGRIGKRGRIDFLSDSIATTRRDAINQTEAKYGPKEDWHPGWRPMKVALRVLQEQQ